jgi:beta-galactosidase
VTTGAPAAVELVPDRNTINADRQDVVIITVRIVDEKGSIVPIADNEVFFHVSDNSQILGVGNGDPACHEPDKADRRRAFNGLVQLIVQAKDQPGDIEVTATSNGLRSAKIDISAEPAEGLPIIPMSAR